MSIFHRKGIRTGSELPSIKVFMERTEQENRVISLVSCKNKVLLRVTEGRSDVLRVSI